MHKTIFSLLFVATSYAHTITADGITNLGPFNFEATFTDPLWNDATALSFEYNGSLTGFNDGSNGTVDSVGLFGLGAFPAGNPVLQASFDSTGLLTTLDYTTGPGGDFLSGFIWASNGFNSAFWTRGQSPFLAMGTVTDITVDGTVAFAPELATWWLVIIGVLFCRIMTQWKVTAAR